VTLESEKRTDIAEVAETLKSLSPIQVEVIRGIIERFAEEQVSELVLTDFLPDAVFEYFSMRLAAHHASSAVPLKKENFEHVLEQAFVWTGGTAQRAKSMTERGADLTVNGTTLSLKTEAARHTNPAKITISKLMEAAWIKGIRSKEDIPPQLHSMVMPHFENYDRIFTLRSYRDREREGHIRYDLREIPRALLQKIGTLQASDFSDLTPTRTTSAEIRENGRCAFKFRLDGSDDKLTITQLDVTFCPLHAWWSIAVGD
jgi:hypothetical protein